MQPFFSIIIPVYNGVSHNIQRCLNSIWKQQVPNDMIEVICVDDCSTDNSVEWLNQERCSHDNLYIIRNSVNIRQGGSRNKGIVHSRGKYCLFIDQDDYYHEGALSQIYAILCNENLDILIVSNTWELDGRPSNKIQGSKNKCEVMSGEEFLISNGPVYVPWKFIFKREYVITNHLFLRENVKLGEDIDWTFKMLIHAQRVQYQPLILVHYVRGIANTSNETNRLEIILACISIYDIMHNHNCQHKMKAIAYNSISYFTKSIIINMFFFNGFTQKRIAFQKLKKHVSISFPRAVAIALKFLNSTIILSEITAPVLKKCMPIWRKYQMNHIWPKIMY